MCTKMPRTSRGAALLAGGLLMLQTGGGTSTAELVGRINASATRPVPIVAPRAVTRPDMVWVPDRYVPLGDQPATALAPGHWERRISDRELYAPPQTIVSPVDGRVWLVPAGPQPAVEARPLSSWGIMAGQ